MKLSCLRKRVTIRPANVALENLPPLFFEDEFPNLPDDGLSRLVAGARSQPTTRIHVQQGLVKGKGGKMRLIGRATYADTGLPLKPAPKKFLPAQVLRRQQQS